MTTSEPEMGAIVRDELRALVPNSNEFDTKALEKRLEEVLALVKQMPNTAKETASSAENEEQSPASRVFRIYELAEIVLANVSRKDLLNVQNITKITRNVARTSKCVQKRRAVRNCRSPYEDPSPFKSSIDFDLTLNMHAADDNDNHYHIIEDDGHSGVGRTVPNSYYLDFHRSLEGKKTWEVCSDYNDGWYGKLGELLYIRTVIVPDGDLDSQELWRFLAVSNWRSFWDEQEEDSQVEVTLHTTCRNGHPFEDVKVFDSDVTMGEVYDFLHERVRDKHPADHCPDEWMRPFPEDWDDRTHRMEW